MQNLARNPIDFEVNEMVLNELIEAQIPIQARPLIISPIKGSQTYYKNQLIPFLNLFPFFLGNLTDCRFMLMIYN